MCLQLFISLLVSLQIPSSKMENKFPTLLTCIDFSLLHPPLSSPTSAGTVIKTLAGAGLAGGPGERWLRGTQQPAELPALAQCLALRRFATNSFSPLLPGGS